MTVGHGAPTFIDTGNAQLYKVVLDIFSGRPNPTWTIDRSHPLYSQIATDLNKVEHTESRDALGYRGFSIEMRNPLGQSVQKTVGAGTYSLLEMELLQSCPFHIRDPVRDHIVNVIAELTNTTAPTLFDQQLNDLQNMDRMAYCKHPKFEPEKWNSPLAMITNNCYNYATQRQTNTFAQPGRGSGLEFSTFTADDVLAAVLRDGLIQLPYYAPELNPELCIIALVVWPNEDYHFYRLDDNYKWSHKMGWDPVVNTDDGGMEIWDPKFANRGKYTVFVSYLGVHPSILVQ